MVLSNYSGVHIKCSMGLLILKLTTSESPKAFISHVRGLKNVMITSELRGQPASENLENVFFSEHRQLRKQAPANRLMSLRIAGVIKTNCWEFPWS